MFNATQVVLIFAIFYHWKLSKPIGEALFETLLVFGMIGYPSGTKIIVGIQIGIEFLLLAVFLAFFVGNLQNKPRRGDPPVH